MPKWMKLIGKTEHSLGETDLPGTAQHVNIYADAHTHHVQYTI